MPEIYVIASMIDMYESMDDYEVKGLKASFEKFSNFFWEVFQKIFWIFFRKIFESFFWTILDLIKSE